MKRLLILLILLLGLATSEVRAQATASTPTISWTSWEYAVNGSPAYLKGPFAQPSDFMTAYNQGGRTDYESCLPLLQTGYPGPCILTVLSNPHNYVNAIAPYNYSWNGTPYWLIFSADVTSTYADPAYSSEQFQYDGTALFSGIACPAGVNMSVFGSQPGVYVTCGNLPAIQPPAKRKNNDSTMCKNPSQPSGLRTLDGIIVADPIEPFTGQQTLREVDYQDYSPHPLNFVRYYRSPIQGDASPYYLPFLTQLGVSWALNYWGQIADISPDGTGPRLVLNRDETQLNISFIPQLLNPALLPNQPAGGTVVMYPTFAPTMTDILQRGNQLNRQTNQNNIVTGWSVGLSDDDRSYTFNASGQVTSVTERNGWVMNYTYNSAGQLSQVTNNFGRSINFGYNAIGQLTQLTPPDGNAITYSYDGQGRLQQVNYADGTVRTYFYENANLPNALTGVAVNGVRDTTYAYDGMGRSISSQQSGGVNSYQISYAGGAPPTPVNPLLATIIDPLGTSRTYTYSFLDGEVTLSNASLTSAEDPSQPFQQFVDQNSGFVIYEGDLNRNLNQYTWDVNRRLLLQSSRSEMNYAIDNYSLVSSNQTRWNSNWRAPDQKSEPGKLITYVYNGSSDPFNGNQVESCAPSSAQLPSGLAVAVLCKKVIQATTDLSGAAGLGATVDTTATPQVWQWTYNAAGQVLTATDPLGNVSNYSYDNLGNLASYTNAMGQTTLYNRYNGGGKLLQSTDANGVVTSYSYDARERLIGVSIGGQTTGYSYGANGQVTQVTLPDGTIQNLTYDAAYRLTGISDSIGNQISYTLDGMGNRIGTQMTGPSGVTVQGSQSFNSLNLLQQATGAQ